MKINELSKISRVNAETIRMYRNKGLLTPGQETNGYYDYSFDDLQMLLFIRKLRGSNLSLETIRYTCTHSDVDDIIRGFERENEELEAQIAMLRRRQEILQLSMRHFESFRESDNGVYEEEVADDRYDLLLRDYKTEPVIGEWIENMDQFTFGLRISPQFLLHPDMERPVGAHICIGTYRPLFEKYGFTIPESAILVPKGRYLAARIEIENPRRFSPGLLRPMLDYASAHGYAFTGDSTGYIFRVDTTGKSAKFIYRLRARVVTDRAPCAEGAGGVRSGESSQNQR